ncbi:hypothetical protein AB4K20DRAFT_1865092 [Rhizopus microsporus]
MYLSHLKTLLILLSKRKHWKTFKIKEENLQLLLKKCKTLWKNECIDIIDNKDLDKHLQSIAQSMSSSLRTANETKKEYTSVKLQVSLYALAARLAQLEERQTFNLNVGGSSPPPGDVDNNSEFDCTIPFFDFYLTLGGVYIVTSIVIDMASTVFFCRHI